MKKKLIKFYVSFKEFMTHGNSSTLVIIVKLLLIMAGTVATGVVALKCWLLIWPYIADILIIIAGIIFLICGLWGADITDYFQKQRMQKVNAQAAFNTDIVGAVYAAACEAASYYKFHEPDDSSCLRPEQHDPFWFFKIGVTKDVLGAFSGNFYDLFVIVQRYLDFIPSCGGKFAVVEHIDSSTQNRTINIRVKIVDVAERDQIRNRWYATLSNNNNEPDPSDFDDDDF